MLTLLLGWCPFRKSMPIFRLFLFNLPSLMIAIQNMMRYDSIYFGVPLNLETNDDRLFLILYVIIMAVADNIDPSPFPLGFGRELIIQ